MIIEPVWSDEDVERLRQRNAERAREAIERLGPAWVFYKRGNAPRQDEPATMAYLRIISRDLAALPLVLYERA